MVFVAGPGNHEDGNRNDLSLIVKILNLIGSIIFVAVAILAFFTPEDASPEVSSPHMNG
jgi:hypothetical protein